MSVELARARGTGREIGRAQGEAFAAGIHDAIAFYRRTAASLGDDLDAMAARARPYLEVSRRAVPDLVDELEGVAEGAGISVDEAVALNCLEEVWPAEACVSMVHGRFFLHAEQWYAGHSAIGVVEARPDDGPAFLSPTCVGFLPAVGLSSAGFAQGIDSLATTDDRVGVPRVLVSRLSMGARGVDDAIAGACLEDRAGGYAHLLATVGSTVAVETTATRYEVLHGIAAHTNHVLAASLRSVTKPPSRGSLARLARADELLDADPPADLEDCARVLSDHIGGAETICLHEEGPDASATVFGFACDLLTGRMIVSDGHPCTGRWHEFGLDMSRSAEHLVG
jgi:isopenicillin-N N-acyltransferase like protein